MQRSSSTFVSSKCFPTGIDVIKCSQNFQLEAETNKDDIVEAAASLSKKLGGITIVAKGEVDIITNGELGNILVLFFMKDPL